MTDRNIDIVNIMLSILRAEINCTELSGNVKNLITPETLVEMYKLSKKHDLAHLLGDYLIKNGLLLEHLDVAKKFLQECKMALCRYEQQRYELEVICSVFEQQKIHFIPLKGSVIRPYYPEPWMRTSGDIDVLVHEKDLERASQFLVENLNYKSEKKTSHDILMFTPAGKEIELHYGLVEEGRAKSASNILKKVWKEDNEKDLIYRFYRYSEQKMLVTVEEIEAYDTNGNPISDPTNVSLGFYVSADAVEAIAEAAEMLLNKVLIS